MSSILGFLPVNRQPAGIDDDLAGALERLVLDARDAGRLQKFRRRIKNGEKPLCHHVVKFLLRLAQARRLLRGRDDGEMVGNLGVVEDAFVWMHPVVFKDRFGKCRVTGIAKHLQRALDRADVILRQRARIGARIRQHLVPLVKRLRQAERVFGAEPEPRIRVALQARQIVEQRRQRRAGLAFLGDNARFAKAFVANGLSLAFFPDAFGFKLVVAVLRVTPGEFFIEPASGVLAGGGIERADDFPIIARNELVDLLLALDQDGQCRGLDPANGGLEETAGLRVKRRHRARAVDADQPVGLRPAVGGVGQRQHVFVFAQPFESLADRGRRHGLQPEPFDGLFGFCVFDDVTKNQFAFTPGIAGVHQRGHVGAFDEFFQDLQPVFRSFNRLQIEMRRDDREAFERPFAAHGLDAFRQDQFEQMADR